MIIKTLEEMEKIVENNTSLKWNGWDVEYYNQEEDGFAKLNGVYLPEDGWGIKKTFKLSNGYWEIPDNILKGK